jgi:TPR repeat protein
MSGTQLNSDYDDSSNNNLLHEFSQIIQDFDKINIKEIEPTTKIINKSFSEEYLSIVNDELVNFIFKKLNEGGDEETVKQYIFNYMYNNKIISQEIYDWVLNNQNNSNSIYLLGYFKFYGIGIDPNKKKAIELYQKAAKLDNSVAQLNLINIYINGDNVDKNYSLAFKFSKKLAEEGYVSGMNNLAWCYANGIGTSFNTQKAFELYHKAADFGNSTAQYNLALMYEENGSGTIKDIEQAIYWYKKSAEQGDEDAQNELKKLLEK